MPYGRSPTRHDLRYFKKTLHKVTGGAVADAGFPIILNSSGKIDASLLPSVLSTDVYFGFTFDNGATVLQADVFADIHIGFAMTIDRWKLYCEPAGSITIDLWKDTDGNYPPTNADSITAGNEVEMSPAPGQFATDATLTGWTTSIAAHENIRAYIDKVTDVRQCLLVIEGTKL